MREGDKHFILHWKTMHPDQHVYGRDIAEAMNNAGIGNGALPALDWWERVEENNEYADSTD